jgi:excisionase family DNA binding protein
MEKRPMNRPISVQEAATALGISQVAVLKRIAKGTLAAKQLSGKGWMVSRDAVEGRKFDQKEFDRLCSLYVSVPQACEIVCVTDGMIGRMLTRGDLDGFRLNSKAWAVSRISCEKNIKDYLASSSRGGRPRVLHGNHAPKQKPKRTRVKKIA